MRPAALLCLLLAGLILAACGGDQDDAVTEVDAALNEAASHFPADCRRLYTRTYLEQTTKLRGEAAVRACEESELETDAEAVTVSAIDVDGDRATADVAGRGPDFDGQVLKVALVRADRWKVDRIVEFVHFDRGELILELGRSLFEQARRPGEADAAGCMLSQLERLDDEALMGLILDPSPQPLLELIQLCEPRSQSA